MTAKPHDQHTTGRHEAQRPEPEATPQPLVSDANGVANCADKEYWRRKGHGGNGS